MVCEFDDFDQICTFLQSPRGLVTAVSTILKRHYNILDFRFQCHRGDDGNKATTLYMDPSGIPKWHWCRWPILKKRYRNGIRSDVWEEIVELCRVNQIEMTVPATASDAKFGASARRLSSAESFVLVNKIPEWRFPWTWLAKQRVRSSIQVDVICSGTTSRWDSPTVQTVIDTEDLSWAALYRVTQAIRDARYPKTSARFRPFVVHLYVQDKDGHGRKELVDLSHYLVRAATDESKQLYAFFSVDLWELDRFLEGKDRRVHKNESTVRA